MARTASVQPLKDVASNDESDDEEEENECMKELCDLEFTFVNKWLTFFVGGLSFVAWNAWYMITTDGGKPLSLKGLLIFTACTVVGLGLISYWHYRHAKDLKAAAAAALDPQKAKETPKDVGSALLEQTYANLTDAMGYVLVEAWTTPDPFPQGQPWLNALMAFSAVLLVIFAVETAERHTDPGGMRSFLDVLGQVVQSGGTFFVVGPLIKGWRGAFEVPEGKAAYWYVGFLALWTGIFISMISSWIAAKLCHADGKEDDTDTTETMCGEKALSLLKAVAFYQGGMMIKKRVIQLLGDEGWGPWGGMLAHSVTCVFIAIALEKGQNCFPLSKEPGPRAYWLKFRQDTTASYMRMNAWIFSGIFNKAVSDFVPHSSKIEWAIVAVVGQIGSLLLDQFRVLRLKKFVDLEEDILSDGDISHADDDEDEEDGKKG